MLDAPQLRCAAIPATLDGGIRGGVTHPLSRLPSDRADTTQGQGGGKTGKENRVEQNGGAHLVCDLIFLFLRDTTLRTLRVFLWDNKSDRTMLAHALDDRVRERCELGYTTYPG